MTSPTENDAGQPGQELTSPYAPPGPATLPASMLPPDADGRGRPTAGPDASQAGRYQLLGEIARGGMGAVIEALDPDLRRLVAVKVLLEQHQGRPDLTARFVEEAQIAGQLQHPGVVPVYELGHLPDQRPFFTMKLVQGETLATLLDARPSPADDLPRFLTIFEAVCQTVAYAHSKGVIHRDLKPSNVMVGAFGEVQVMDWGLAKSLLRPNEEGAFAPGGGEHDGPSAQTAVMSQLGAVMGTPAFMSPEQARGEPVDERADVFGLGAILCVILTGKPPFEGASSRDVHARAERGDLADASERLRGCAADKELLRLVLDCLAPDREGRPSHAGVVAQAMTDYHAGAQARLRQAETERAVAVGKVAGERKARRLTAALAAALVGLVVLGVVGWRWQEWQRQARQDRLDEVAGQAEDDLRQSEELWEQARAGGGPEAWAAALAAARRAEGRLAGQEVDEELRQRAQKAVADLVKEQADRRMLERIEKARLRQLELRDEQLDLAGAAAEYARAFQEHGLDVLALPVEEAARGVRDSAIRAELAAALDDWAESLGNDANAERLREVARQGDPSSFRQRLRDARARRDRGALRELARSADLARLPSASVALLARALIENGEKGPAIEVLRRAQLAHSLDFWINFQLGAQLERGGRLASVEAARFYTVARALRPQAPAVHLNLGNALVRAGTVEAGIASYREAILLKKDYAMAHYNLGLAELRARRPEAAIVAFREAIRLRPNYAEAHNNLGNVYHELNRNEEALGEYRRGIALRPKHAAGYLNVGAVLAEQGKFEEAVASYREALRFDEASATAHNNLGSALHQLDDLDGAEAHLREAIRLRPTLDLAYTNLGRLLRARGDLPGALAAYRDALRLLPNDAVAHFNLGTALQAARRFPEAASAFQEAIHRDGKLPGAYQALGSAYRGMGRLDAAIASYRKDIKLRPRVAGPRIDLGTSLADKGMREEAVRSYREALELQPKSVLARVNLGIALRQLGRLDEALVALGEGARLAPNDAWAHRQLGVAWLAKGRLPDALAALRRAVELRPGYVEAHHALGEALMRAGRPDQAILAYRQAVRLRPSHAEALADLGRAEEATGAVGPAIQSYRASVRARPMAPAGWIGLGRLQVRQGELKEAVEALRRGDVLAELGGEKERPSAKWLAEAVRLLALEKKLPAIVKGDVKAVGARERLDFALLCACKGHPAAAVPFFEGAFREALELAGAARGHRFEAACAAARAGCGIGDVKERARWRGQALEWLRADLAYWEGEAKARPASTRGEVALALRGWQGDGRLACAREAAALEKLPEAERAGWRRLWQEVAALGKSARGG